MTLKERYEQFIIKAKQIHGDKYDYSKVEYVNSYTKVCIICPKHGEFWIEPTIHLYWKRGCPKCSHSYSPTTQEWVKRAQQIHKDKYDYSKVEYINAHTKVCIICPIHGEFWQRPSSHIDGCGCPNCRYDVLSQKYALTKEEFVKRAISVHGDKYDYSKVEYKNDNDKVCIICPIHGEFWQNAKGHIWNHQGCPLCKRSKMEEFVELVLTENNIVFEKQKKFEWLKFKESMLLDFYLPQYNIAIECQGGQHFDPVKKYGGEEGLLIRHERDKLKYHLCLENNINILYIVLPRYFKSDIFQEFYKNKDVLSFKDVREKLTKKLS